MICLEKKTTCFLSWRVCQTDTRTCAINQGRINLTSQALPKISLLNPKILEFQHDKLHLKPGQAVPTATNILRPQIRAPKEKIETIR